MTNQDSALILIADDDDLTRIQLRHLMEYAGYQVAEVSNGCEAITTYTRLSPDIVLLDAMMPVMDGFSCCAQLQTLPNAEDTPVLMITAAYDQASVDRAFAVGASDFITKPIQLQVLLHRIRHLLAAHRAIKQLRQQTQHAQLREAQLQIALEAARMGIWDWDITTNKVTWSDNKEALFGLEKGSFDGRYETFLSYVHPQDRDFVSRSIMQAAQAAAEYDIEFRVLLPDGNIRWLASKGVVFYNSIGEPVRMSGVDIDITKRKQAEAALEVHAHQRALIAELSQMALAGTNLTTLMNSCVMLVAQCLKVEYCKVLELLPDGKALLLRAGVGWQPGLVGQATVSAAIDSQAGYTLISEEPVIVDDLRTETRFSGPELLLNHQVVSGMSVVIPGKKHPFGVLGVHTTKQRTFSQDDIYFLQAIANLLATAIERQQADEQLRQSEERFQIVTCATNDVIWDWDLLTNQVWWNQAVEILFGYSLETLDPDISWWIENIHPDDQERIVTATWAVINSGEKFWSKEYRFRCSDGSYADILDRAYVVHDHTGKPIKMIGAMMDITERKQAQAQLQWQNLRSQLFSDITLKIRQSLQIDEILQTSVTEVQKLLNADRVLILRRRSNGAFITLKEAVVPGLPIALGLQINEPAFGEICLQQYRQGEISAINNVNQEQANIPPPHLKLLQQFCVQANLCVPIFLQNQFWGLLVAHQCVHPRQWTNWEIELLQQLANQIGIALAQSQILETETRQRQELSRSNEELQQFAFIASHDLQEPLRKIKTFSERLVTTCGDSLTEQGQDYLERMQSAVFRMQTLIEDLLTLSRVTTRAQPFALVNLAHITQEVLSDLEVRIQQTGASVEVGYLPKIKADPIQMRQLIQNLIGNALKFQRPQVPPIVKIYGQYLNNQSEQFAASSEFCQIIIEDNGIGFEQKYCDRIFNIFQRLHGRREYEGTGIGLAICRKIVERHHGNITAQSQLGAGAKFSVILPINSPI
jgi:PAS domain S-box-containing protein